MTAADNSEMPNKPEGNSPPDIASLVKVKKSYFFRKLSFDGAIDKLKAVIEGQGLTEIEPNVAKASSDCLLDTCKLIGYYEKIQFKPAFANASEAWSPLKNILRSSNVRSQTVALQKGWWSNDHGHFLAYLKEGDTPVALIWDKSVYKLYDYQAGTCQTVSAKQADLIKPAVISFFSPLPTGTVNALSLIKFALLFTKRDVIFFLILGLVGALLALIIPISAGYVFNVIIPGGSLPDLYQIGVVLISLVMVLGFIEFTRAIAVLRFEGKASYKLQSAVFDRLLSIKVPFFSKYDSGNLAERSMSIEKIRVILSANVMSALVSVIFSLLYLALMLYYDVRLALLALLLGAVVASFTLTISLLAYKHVAGYMRMEAIISGFMMMMLGGIQKIRLTATGDKVFNIWADKFAQQKQHYADKQKLLIVVSIFTFSFPILASILIYLRIHELLTVAGSGFQFGDFIAFNSAYLSFQGALISAFMVTVPLMSIKPAYELLLPILEAEVEDYDDKIDIGEMQGNIEISNLNFRYADAPDLTLRNISLDIKSGEFVALVGGSGSGKSTLLRVLMGFEEYETGVILYDGYDLTKLDIRSFRDQTGVVLQDGKILEGSVLFNIVGPSNYTEEDAWEAAKQAGCFDDIKNLEHGMQTELAANGGILSGGQKQRILIARALLKKPKLLLFDEATSALDNEAQTTVSESVNQLQATRIVIAHRLSTIKKADKIIVLEQGEIIEQGSYEELIALRKTFFELVEKQLN